jgi:rhomboid protease GluP
MEWNQVLLWIVAFSGLANLAASLRARPRVWGFAGVAFVMLGVTGAVYWFRPDRAGLVGGGVMVVLIVVPSVLLRLVQRWAFQQRYDLARWPAAAAGLLHPFDGVRQQARVIHALHRVDRGDVPAAEAMLRSLSHAPTRVARSAQFHLCRLTNRWPDWVAWADANVPFEQLRRDPALIAGHVRALGESGRLSAMVAAAAAQRLPHHPVVATHRALCRLFAFSFAGRGDWVDALLAGPLRNLPPATAAFWRATADLAAGDPVAAEARLTAVEPTAAPGTRAAITFRRANPVVLAAAVLTPADHHLLDRLHREALHEERYVTLGRDGRPWVTYGLVAANVGMFVAECVVGHGDATQDEMLTRMGALLPDVFQTGQYHRLFVANFLHAGTAHILMNMLGLLVLGPFVERSLGRAVYLIVYMVSGMLALAAVAVMQQHHLVIEGPLVGASAAIMALIGATAAVLLRGWVRERAAVAARRFRATVALVLTQAVFDYMTPQVSGAAHLAGAAFGFALACLLPHRQTPRRTGQAEPRTTPG